MSLPAAHPTEAERQAWDHVALFAENRMANAITAIRADVGLGGLGLVARAAVRASSARDGIDAERTWRAMRGRILAAVETIDESMLMLRRRRWVLGGRTDVEAPNAYLDRMMREANNDR